MYGCWIVNRVDTAKHLCLHVGTTICLIMLLLHVLSQRHEAVPVFGLGWMLCNVAQDFGEDFSSYCSLWS